MKLVLLKSVRYSVPRTDKKGNPVMAGTVKFNGRTLEIQDHDHFMLWADGKVVDVPDDIGEELVEDGHARPADAFIDAEEDLGEEKTKKSSPKKEQDITL